MDRNRIISPREVEHSIADGQTLVIYAGDVLKLDGWLDKHPGGRLAILHMVGRDATDEINVYHHQHTQRLMPVYRIGKVQQPWTNFVPPIRGGIYRKRGEVDADTDTVGSEEDTGKWSDWDAESTPMSSSSSTSSLDTLINSDNELSKVSTRETIPLTATFENPIPTRRRGDVVSGKGLTRAEYTAACEEKELFDDIQAYPSLDGETQRAISLEYKALHERVQKEGFYNCRYSEYGKDSIRWFFLFGMFLYLLNAKWYLTSACFLGMFWQQIMFAAHDAGHRGITGHFVTDTLIGAFVADFCCGLSIGWWKSSHNVHHLITNMPEHDPDLQNVPLFATAPQYFKSVLSTFYNFTFVWDGAADVAVRFQKYTYYPVMALARFNLYFLSWRHLLSPLAPQPGSWWINPVEISMMICYWALFGYGLVWCTLPNWPTRIAFVLISHCITMLLHVQITLSHWGMPTADLGPTEAFSQRQLRTTMDVECPQWLDFLHGGLQFQACHHLFPRVPRHNLRRLQVLVKEFCEKTGVKYKCYAFVEGNKIVLSRLEEVAKMVEVLVKCQVHMAETGESGLH